MTIQVHSWLLNKAMSEPSARSQKRICVECVGDAFLKDAIKNTGQEATCAYCDQPGPTFSIGELADRVEEAFEQHYESTPTEPDGYEYAMMKEGLYDWERGGEEVIWAIASAANIEDDPAADIQAELEDKNYDHESATMGEECPFASDSHYELKDLGCAEFSERWDQFERGLKTEARFFSREAQAVLEELFADLPNLRTSKGAPVIVNIGPETAIPSLHRARVFAAEDDKLKLALGEPWKGLGSPPMLAAAAGRMNARGIAVFYGAIEPETALAEVRPPVGSQVAVAKFTVTRPLRLLDVEALRSVKAAGSIFDPNYRRQAQQAQFMETLSHRITRPVMPNEEVFEYLATQAVADFLATESKLDGIIFPSVQTDHKSANVVLFHHAARVENVPLPEGTEIEVYLEEWDEDSSYPDYRVMERVPKPDTAPPKAAASPFRLRIRSDHTDDDPRSVSLKIDLENVEIHYVKAVRFDTAKLPVHRHRTEKQEGSDFLR